MPGSEVTLTVPFFDADMLGIVWHGHYVKYFEVARCALLDRIGYDYLTMKATGYVWPVVDLQIRYLAPARFGQTLKVSAVLKEYEYRMKIGYEIRAAEPGDRLARGRTVQVAVSAVA
ncbi:MAG: acyl-CoA thioesterase, partial [Methylothermaceae bacterium]|nr:acyl-CoA thioesterase [Methylothermaceae bacterium]